ncbi:MAG TPA: biopolymer transporter ExbD [Verrucomicrobiae bacterium]|jgi:biopolymer transport protein ExbD|nr:biopolymer transporter ExbD [Verrucomicrobiae bacterium]
MKFQRNLRIVQGRFEIAPYACVFFLLILFVLLLSLVPTPGLPLNLPQIASAADNDSLPGADHPTISVAVDSSGQFYFENQLVDEAQLKQSLFSAVQKSKQTLTLVVQADKSVAYENIVRLAMLARTAGINNALLATLPRPWSDTRPAP